MRADFETLFESMNRSVSYRPTNLPAALESLPPVDQLPRPSSTWLYIGLGLHRLKQERAWAMLKERLPDTIPPSDELLERFNKAGPPLTLRVPGGDRWVVELECSHMDAFLSKQGTRERLWISVEDDQHGDHKIDLQLFLECLEPMSRWDPESRLLDLGLYLDDDLVAAQVLEVVDDHGRPAVDVEQPWYILSDGAILRQSLIDEFSMHWRDHENRLWLSAVLNDWALAYELAQACQDAELIEITAARAAECQQYGNRGPAHLVPVPQTSGQRRLLGGREASRAAMS